MRGWIRILPACAWLGVAGCLDPRPEAVASVPPDPALQSLDWLVGCWIGADEEGGRHEEHWIPAAGGTMLGLNRVVAGGRTVFFEYLRIEKRDDGIYYVANPRGRGESEFTLVAQEDRRAVFDNPDHDYPVRIFYWRTGDVLSARLEGEVRGRRRAETYRWQLKVP
jgi:hypothetical protein